MASKRGPKDPAKKAATAKLELMRLEESSAVTSAALGCAQLLDAGLEELLGPLSAGEEGLVNGGSLAIRVARRLAFLRRSYEMTKEALARVEDELRRARRRRDRARRELYELARNLRKLCHGLYGRAQGDEFLGLHGQLPREPKELYLAFAPVVGRLADEQWPMPRASTQSIKADRQKMVSHISKVHGALGDALDVIENAETRAVVLRAGKKRAKKALVSFLGKSRRFLTAALELAGLDDLVAVMGPGAARRGRPAKAQLGDPAAPASLPQADPRQADLPAGAAEPKALPTSSADEPEEPDDL